MTTGSLALNREQMWEYSHTVISANSHLHQFITWTEMYLFVHMQTTQTIAAILLISSGVTTVGHKFAYTSSNTFSMCNYLN